MISHYNVLPAFQPRELADYGFARARDIAFDAIQVLWRRRRAEGMRQADIVAAIGRDAGWVSRNLRAPGNWTLRTIGELVEALNGELEIIVLPKEDAPEHPSNYHAYMGYELPHPHGTRGVSGGSQFIGTIPAGFSGMPVRK
ncbi:MAG TPA: hypothetical protein VM755_06295 [Stellaceae bacterium]|nr:hypothetical protein [Stellaceae bacterium]